ncbi:MAG: YceI family protein [Bacteriovoracia bacterium]
MKTLFIVLIGCISLSLFAQEKWTINKDHSEVLYQVSYLKVSEVTGRFRDYQGELHFNEKNLPERLSLELRVESLDSGNTLRDGHLKAQDFLYAKKYPVIRFTSQKIEQLRPTRFKAIGELVIREKIVTTTIEFDLVGPLKDTWGHQSRFAKFSTLINRKDFGIQWNKTLEKGEYLVGDVIKVWGQFQLQVSNDKTPTTKHLIPDTPAIREREKLARGEKAQIASNTASSDSAILAFKEEHKLDVSTDKVMPIETEVQGRHSTLWWVSLATLGMMGFLASMVLGLYAKKVFLDMFQEKYHEAGMWGNLSDFAVIFFVMIYAVVFYIVGWTI